MFEKSWKQMIVPPLILNFKVCHKIQFILLAREYTENLDMYKLIIGTLKVVSLQRKVRDQDTGYGVI